MKTETRRRLIQWLASQPFFAPKKGESVRQTAAASVVDAVAAKERQTGPLRFDERTNTWSVKVRRERVCSITKANVVVNVGSCWRDVRMDVGVDGRGEVAKITLNLDSPFIRQWASGERPTVNGNDL